MTQSKEDILKKWTPILEGSNRPKFDWVSEYTQSNSTFATHSTFESSLLPIAIRIAAQTIGNNLVSVQPMGGGFNLDEIKKDVKSTNRDRKIDSVIEGKKYEEMKIEDHPDFKKSMPKGQLFYLDYQYGTSSASNP